MPVNLADCRRLDALIEELGLDGVTTAFLLNDRLGTRYDKQRVNQWRMGHRPIPSWVFAALENRPLTDLQERHFKFNVCSNRAAGRAQADRCAALFADYLSSLLQPAPAPSSAPA